MIRRMVRMIRMVRSLDSQQTGRGSTSCGRASVEEADYRSEQAESGADDANRSISKGPHIN